MTRAEEHSNAIEEAIKILDNDPTAKAFAQWHKQYVQPYIAARKVKVGKKLSASKKQKRKQKT